MLGPRAAETSEGLAGTLLGAVGLPGWECGIPGWRHKQLPLHFSSSLKEPKNL